MDDLESSPTERLIAALQHSDEARRNERAQRIIWMSQYNSRPGVIMGTAEEIGVLNEAEDAFREGHFISVILLALALVEHQLVDELVRRGLANYGISISAAIELARQNHVLQPGLLDRVDQLRAIRNPFVHRKKPDHVHSYGNRYRTRNMPPRTLLEEDAMEGFQVMYEVFRALLREAA